MLPNPPTSVRIGPNPSESATMLSNCPDFCIKSLEGTQNSIRISIPWKCPKFRQKFRKYSPAPVQRAHLRRRPLRARPARGRQQHDQRGRAVQVDSVKTRVESAYPWFQHLKLEYRKLLQLLLSTSTCAATTWPPAPPALTTSCPMSRPNRCSRHDLTDNAYQVTSSSTL